MSASALVMVQTAKSWSGVHGRPAHDAAMHSRAVAAQSCWRAICDGLTLFVHLCGLLFTYTSLVLLLLLLLLLPYRHVESCSLTPAALLPTGRH
jgi:hypothetical protein